MKLPLLLSLLTLCLTAYAQPRIDKFTGHDNRCYGRLTVDGKPMLMIGGELGNSSASTSDDLRRIFPHLSRLGLNTVLVPVSWELIEPHEGRYDFTSVESILTEAAANDLKVVVLWFGAWKNGQSCYAPEWFKLDTERFPRVLTAEGKPLEEATSVSDAVLDADRNAFCRLMAYLKEHDSNHTVVMVQVENEIGIFETARDHHPEADRMYRDKVPAELRACLDAKGAALHPYMRERYKGGGPDATWAEVFGDDDYGQEIFQAWTYARYVQQLAEAGKSVYDMPMYVNVALDSRGRRPGEYSSGGPLARLIDIWQCGAPDIDVYGLDLYDKGFTDWVSRYHLPNNPLFIPEIRLEDRDAMYAVYAFGKHGAMGFCPFSIEDYPLTAASTQTDWRDVDLSADDQLNAFSAAGEKLSPLAAAYRLLRQAQPLIIEKQGTADIDAVLLDNERREAEMLTPDGVRVTVRHSLSMGWEPASRDSVWPEAACMIIRLAPMDYLVLGSDVVLTFTPAESGAQWQPGDNRIGIARCEEVTFSDGDMRVVRTLNGDQTHQGRHVRIPCGQYGMQRFRLYRY